LSQTVSISEPSAALVDPLVGAHPPVSAVAIYEPERRWRLLRRLIPKALQPALRGVRKRAQLMLRNWRGDLLPEPYATVFPYTQAHLIRQENIVRLAGLLDASKIPGDLVECGVLDGGTAALMAHATAQATPERMVHLFDSWAGLPRATVEDGERASEWSGEDVGSPARVLAVMRKLNVRRGRLVFHHGWFEKTFPAARIEAIALLHIDADFYNSVRLCLETWYPRLSPGAFVQIDDYDSFSGCHAAVNAFLAAHQEVTLESYGQDAKAWFFRKPT
jgi:O-methyltransferase